MASNGHEENNFNYAYAVSNSKLLLTVLEIFQYYYSMVMIAVYSAVIRKTTRLLEMTSK